MKSLVTQFVWELRKTFSRPQAWSGFVAVLVFTLLFFSLLQLNSVRPSLRAFLTRFGALVDGDVSGLTLARSFAGQIGRVMASIFVALVAVESVTGEVET